VSRKQPPPLTPADSRYLGEDVNGRHALRWRSQSRDTVTHVSRGRLGGPHTCSCEWFKFLVKQGTLSPSCKHTRGHDDAVSHHLDESSPADPGGAALTAAQAALDDEINDWILGGKLSPPPWLVAPGERQRRHDDGMATLYGDDWRTI
jgi:hypothetical protein